MNAPVGGGGAGFRRSAVDHLAREVAAAATHHDMEYGLVGGMLWSAKVADLAIEAGFDPEALTDPLLRAIAGVILALRDEGREVNAPQVDARLAGDEEYDAAGGRAFLASLITACPGVPVVPSYVRETAELHRRRRLVEAAAAALRDVCGPVAEAPSEAIVAKLAGELDGIAAGAAQEPPVVTAHDAAARVLVAAEEAFANGGVARGLRTGFASLDAKLRPMEPGHLVVLAARPSMGKSAAAFDIAWRAAKTGARVALFSLEMTAAQVSRRILAGETGIPIRAIQDGRLHHEQWHALTMARAAMEAVPLHIDETPGKTLAGIAMRCRSLARRGPLGLIVVDHIGLVMPPHDMRRHGLTQIVEHTSNGLKRLAREMRCPVLALCQLNRQVEGRENKMPGLSDLRQSGSIEQDADVVMFLFRDAYYLARQPPRRLEGETDERYRERVDNHRVALERAEGWAEVSIGKQRDGEEDIVKLRFDRRTTRFSDPPETDDGDDGWGGGT